MISSIVTKEKKKKKKKNLLKIQKATQNSSVSMTC